MLKNRDLKRRANQVDWLPAGLPRLPCELSVLLENRLSVQNYSSKVIKSLLGKKQNIGCGESLFWHFNMETDDLTNKTKELLRKSEYKKSKICLDDLVRWGDLVNGQSGIAQGPGAAYYRYKKVSWQLVLKVLIEVSTEQTI